MLLAEVIVTPSLARSEGRGVYGDGDGGWHVTTQAGVEGDEEKTKKSDISSVFTKSSVSLPPCSVYL